MAKWEPISFDRWFELKHSGFSFESQYMNLSNPNHNLQSAFKGLVKETKSYVTDMVEEMASKCQK